MKNNNIACRYKGGAFVPLSPSAVKIPEGELVFLRIDRKRYWPGHQAFMALINEAFETLSDVLKHEFMSPDIFRRRLLIAAEQSKGSDQKNMTFATITSIACTDDKEAKNLAAKIGAYADEHSFLSIVENHVVIARASSQAMSEMDADTFKASCIACVEQLERLFGCSSDEIKAHYESLKGHQHHKPLESPVA